MDPQMIEFYNKLKWIHVPNMDPNTMLGEKQASQCLLYDLCKIFKSYYVAIFINMDRKDINHTG
jgi:hypothetical protein